MKPQPNTTENGARYIREDLEQRFARLERLTHELRESIDRQSSRPPPPLSSPAEGKRQRAISARDLLERLGELTVQVAARELGTTPKTATRTLHMLARGGHGHLWMETVGHSQRLVLTHHSRVIIDRPGQLQKTMSKKEP